MSLYICFYNSDPLFPNSLCIPVCSYRYVRLLFLITSTLSIYKANLMSETVAFLLPTQICLREHKILISFDMKSNKNIQSPQSDGI